jgi:hypothetical protein
MQTLIRALGTSAIVIGIAIPVAAADMSRLSLGGVYLAAATAQDDAKDPKIKETAFEQGTEIRFKGRTVLDPGLEVGFHTEMSRHGFVTDGGPKAMALAGGAEHRQLESVYIYVKSGFGTVAFGAPHRMTGSPGDLETALAPITNGDDSGVSFPAFHPLELRNSASAEAAAKLGKVSYFTPRIGGMQIGVSFAPEAKLSPAQVTDLGWRQGALSVPATYEFDANYKTAFKRFKVELGGSYLTASDGATGTLSGWGAAGAFGYTLGRGSLSLAGAYRTSDCANFVCPGGNFLLSNAGAGDMKAWNVGLRYSAGSFALGGYFLTAHSDSSLPGASDHDTTVFLQTAFSF